MLICADPGRTRKGKSKTWPRLVIVRKTSTSPTTLALMVKQLLPGAISFLLTQPDAILSSLSQCLLQLATVALRPGMNTARQVVVYRVGQQRLKSPQRLMRIAGLQNTFTALKKIFHIRAAQKDGMQLNLLSISAEIVKTAGAAQQWHGWPGNGESLLQPSSSYKNSGQI